MCNLYSLAKGQQAIRAFTGVMRDAAGKLPPSPGVFPDCNALDGVRELSPARWGMPSPAFALESRTNDAGVTNARNAALSLDPDRAKARDA